MSDGPPGRQIASHTPGGARVTDWRERPAVEDSRRGKTRFRLLHPAYFASVALQSCGSQPARHSSAASGLDRQENQSRGVLRRGPRSWKREFPDRPAPGFRQRAKPPAQLPQHQHSPFALTALPDTLLNASLNAPPLPQEDERVPPVEPSVADAYRRSSAFIGGFGATSDLRMTGSLSSHLNSASWSIVVPAFHRTVSPARQRFQRMCRVVAQ